MNRPLNLGQSNWWQRLSPTDRWAIIGLGFFLAALIVLALIFVPSILGREGVDLDTSCPVDGPVGHTVVVIDRTDPLEPSQSRLVLKVMEELKAELATGEMLSIHEVDPGPVNGLSDPLFSLCKPRDGKSARSFDENKKFLQRHYEERFGEPLEEALRKAIPGGGADRSPIMESLLDLAILPEFRRDKNDRRLVIFSDLMQHSSSWSQYRQIGSFEEFMATPVGASLVPDLGDIELRLYYLMRFQKNGAPLQGQAHYPFWERYFEAAGVTNIEVNRVR